jgi:hypothetical protein
MNCRNGERCGLFVFVVQFVEVLVEEWRMVHAVQPVCSIVLKENNIILITAEEISFVLCSLAQIFTSFLYTKNINHSSY